MCKLNGQFSAFYIQAICLGHFYFRMEAWKLRQTRTVVRIMEASDYRI
jgi:hypothetical protein